MIGSSISKSGVEPSPYYGKWQIFASCEARNPCPFRCVPIREGAAPCDPQRELEELRKQLSVPGWQRVVEARSRKEESAVDVYLFVDRNLARGMAIIAREPREFAIVNIVGAVDLQKLHQLEGRFGIPKLELQAGESQRKSGER